jgi:nucleotide-binding universal stress UspA family protein
MKLDVNQVCTNHTALSWHFQQAEEFRMYQRILVATDGSTLSKKAVNSAIALAATCGAYFEGSIPLAASEIGRIEKQWTEAAQASLDAVQKIAKTKGVTVKTVTVKSDVVSDAIIATAKKQKVDLIVMASHGRKGIKRLLLGSETQQVLTHSHTPVLVLR